MQHSKKSNSEIKIRLNTTDKISDAMPVMAKTLIDYYTAQCVATGKCHVSFSVEGMPKSVNHQHVTVRRQGRPIVFLSPEAKVFRQQAYYAMGSKRKDWKPTGVTCAVLIFESPQWVTKKLAVRKMDCDNRIKPVFDAIQEATGSPDELHWNIHAFKIASHRERTTAFLFDLGDIVDYYCTRGNK
jgi:Holliday junction resolvase RusA-like endonuclease